MLIAIATDDAANLGILSSRIHVIWALRAGGWLGVGNDPRYSKSRCFDPFPFPDTNNIQKQNIRVIAEELDTHRKRVLAEHPHLTLTGLYNVLEMLRVGTKPDVLDEHERKTFDDGLVLIMKELHDRLDVAVAEAYGWPPDLSDDEVLARLVALNKERSAEEKRGLVRWLRPEYQIPRFAKGVDKQAAKEEGAQVAAELVSVTEHKPSFPSGAVESTAAVFAALAAASEPLDAKGLAARFKRTRTTDKKVGEVLASLARLGYVTSSDLSVKAGTAVRSYGNASRAISPAASTCSRRQIEGVAPGRSDLVRAIARIALSRPSLQRILRVIERHADIGAALHVDQPAKAAAMRGVGPVLAALDYGFTKDRRVTHRRRTRSPCRRSLQSGSASTPPRD